jgi:hypothetical protein
MRCQGHGRESQASSTPRTLASRWIGAYPRPACGLLCFLSLRSPFVTQFESSANKDYYRSFFEIQPIRTGNPVLGAFPVDPQAFECLADGLGADQAVAPALPDAFFGYQGQCPQTGFVPKIAWGMMQEGLEGIGIDARDLCA